FIRSIFPRAIALKILIENQYKIITEVFRNEPTIINIADNFALFRNDLYLTMLQKAGEDQISLFLFRKGEPHVRSTLYGTDLCLYPVIKLYGIIMWFSNFIIMVKRQSSFIFIDKEVSLSRHQGENRIITHPRSTLVYLLKTT